MPNYNKDKGSWEKMAQNMVQQQAKMAEPQVQAQAKLSDPGVSLQSGSGSGGDSGGGFFDSISSYMTPKNLEMISDIGGDLFAGYKGTISDYNKNMADHESLKGKAVAQRYNYIVPSEIGDYNVSEDGGTWGALLNRQEQKKKDERFQLENEAYKKYIESVDYQRPKQEKVQEDIKKALPPGGAEKVTAAPIKNPVAEKQPQKKKVSIKKKPAPKPEIPMYLRK